MSTLMDFEKENEAQIYEHYLVHAMQEKICEIMNRKKVSKTELAKKMKITKSEVSRLLGEGRNLSIKTVAKIFFALGEELDLATKSETQKISETYAAEVSKGSQAYLWHSTDVSIEPKAVKRSGFPVRVRVNGFYKHPRYAYAK